MPRFLFRGAFVRFADLRYDEKSRTPYLKINFTSSFSDPIRKAMEWGEPPAGFASAKLDGEYIATQLILTPNGREMAANELQIEAKEISGFELHRVTGEDGESKENELRFQVVTADPEAQAEDTAREDGATVAPAATMGGTHQRSTRGPRANREKVN